MDHPHIVCSPGLAARDSSAVASAGKAKAKSKAKAKAQANPTFEDIQEQLRNKAFLEHQVFLYICRVYRSSRYVQNCWILE